MYNLASLKIWSLWVFPLTWFMLTWVLWIIADKLRGTPIENREDHRNPKIFILSIPSMLALLIVSIFTPIVSGLLFWMGFIFQLIAAFIYILSIIAFIKSKTGLNKIGIYRISRNPMYVAAILLFIGLALMAWSAGVLTGVLLSIITLWKIIAFYWVIRHEESFLESKYGNDYIEYKKVVPRYLLFI